MKLNHVIVVSKKNVSQAGRAWQKMHDNALARVLEVLKERKISSEAVERADIKKGMAADLIIAVGGDGTILSCAHAAGNVPIMGVNSMPGHSVGFFAAADAKTFAGVLTCVICDTLKISSLPLIEVCVNEEPLPHLALNEMLFAGKTPAEMVRYELKVGKRREAQKSSGVWIAAGPGSTAAIRSAGGKKMRIDSKRLQFVVREPYRLPGKEMKLVKGILKKNESIQIIPHMSDGAVYIDGPKNAFEATPGSKITARIAGQTLKIIRAWPRLSSAPHPPAR